MMISVQAAGNCYSWVDVVTIGQTLTIEWCARQNLSLLLEVKLESLVNRPDS